MDNETKAHRIAEATRDLPVTTEDVEALMKEADVAGDLATVNDCRAALLGNAYSRGKVLSIIRTARANAAFYEAL